MGVLREISQFYPQFKSVTYKEPERLSEREIRQRRLFGELERQRKALEAQPSRLSQANLFHKAQLQEAEKRLRSQFEIARNRVVAVKAAARRNPSFKRSVAYKAAMAGYFQFWQQRPVYNTSFTAGYGPYNNASFAGPSGVRQNGAPGRSRTVQVNRRGQPLNQLQNIPRRMYHSPSRLFDPCEWRSVRREVMFAKGHGGVAHHVPHRLTPSSWIGC